MYDSEGPTLEVGFSISTGASYDELMRLGDMMESTEVKVMREAAAIERATSGMINVGGGMAQLRSLTTETAAFGRERARAERAGEGLSRQMARDIANFGKTRAEIRATKAETAALAAEQAGLTELAGRLRAQQEALAAAQASAAAAAARQAQEVRAAANAHLAFEAAARRGMQAVREQEAAQAAAARETQQMAAAADRLRTTIDPTYAAQSRFNREMQEAQMLISRGAISLDDYAAKLRMERAALDASNAAHARGAVSVGAHRQAMMGASYQVQDLMTQISMGANPINALAVQGSQLAGQFANVEGKAGALARFFMGPWGMAITGAVMLAGMLSKSLFDNADSMKTAELAADSFGGAQGALGQMFDLTTGKIKAQNEMLRLNIQLTAINLRADALAAEKTAQDAEQAAGQRSWSGWFGAKRPGSLMQSHDTLAKRNLQGVMRGDLDPSAIAKWAEGADFSGVNMSREEFMTAVAKVVEVRRNRDLANRIESSLEGGKLDSAFLSPASPKAPGADARKAKGLTDQQRAYADATKAAKEYAASQIEEAAKLGLSAKQLRLYADAAAIAKAPTDELRKSIQAAADKREQAFAVQAALDYDSTVLQPLRDELALYGLTGPARAAAALDLEKQGFMAKHMGDGIAVATQRWDEYSKLKRQLIDKDAATALEADRIKQLNEALAGTAEIWDVIANNVQNAARGISDAFGSAGGAIGDLATIYAGFRASQAAGDAEHARRLSEANTAEARAHELARHTLTTSTAQLGMYGDMTSAAKGFFKEKSTGWKIVAAAEKAFRAFEFAMSIRSMVQDASETVSSVANSAARATANGAEGIAAQAKLPFPYNIAAMAATGAALIAAGIAILGSGGGGGSKAPETNKGTGTVFGDPSAQSESIKRSIDALREVDTLMLNYSRQMAASLRSIESQIGGFANLIVRNTDGITDGGGIAEGFKTTGIGTILNKIPLIGGILGGLFGTKTTLLASGLYGGAQSLGDILGGGFQADYFSDVQKKKKLFGITTSNKTSTTFTGADPLLENQFTLILKSFNDAIVAAAGPLGAATAEIQQRLNGFTLSLGKIDLKGLTGAEIEEKLNAVFGAAADNMARAAFPFIDQFQKVGEGAFETLVRVSSTIEAVGATLDLLGQSAQGMGIAAKLGLADQFESVSALTSAVDAYFSAFYTKEEQAAARSAQMGKVFESLGLAMPATLAAFRQLVEAQDLTSAAGQETYATLLKLAPAFADLQAAMSGAKSAADIASERTDLQRQMLELQGDTAALRALQLAKLDASNRALQQEIWAIQDAQAAAKAADELRKAWQGVGDSIADEVRRIRGLSDATGGNTFASLQGQFNAATLSARAGDMDAAKSLPGLSKALLDAAAEAARSRQELDRIRAQIAASLEQTQGLLGNPALSNAALLNAGATSQPETVAVNDNRQDMAALRADLTAKLEQLRAENTAALATIAANTGRVAKKMDDVTSQSGGDAIATVSAAA